MSSLAPAQATFKSVPRKVIYLSGPMTGIPLSNYPAFRAAAAELRRRGFKVISPAELDAQAGIDSTTVLSDDQYATVLLSDLRQIRKCDFVYTLPGWEKSGGAKAEVAFAQALGIPVRPYTYPTPRLDRDIGRLRKLTPKPRSGETRVVDPVTGGAKGTKPERFELLPWSAVGEIAKVYAFGADKYDDHNWRKGYRWSLSFGALLRHLTLFWDGGEDIDPESGLPHLAHAGFHILALLTYLNDGKGTDDRYRGPAA